MEMELQGVFIMDKRNIIYYGKASFTDGRVEHYGYEEGNERTDGVIVMEEKK